MPFGGALIYVPEEWVKPAEGGVERLMNVYVSMGVTPPLSMPVLRRKPLATKAVIIEATAAKPAISRERPSRRSRV